MQDHVFWLLLAFTCIYASPAPHPLSLSKTFSVPCVRQYTSQLRNGFAAHTKVFRKYGWSEVNLKSDAFSSTTMSSAGQSGAVNVTAEEYDTAYITPVTIGKGASAQRLNIDLDTGSSDFWVFSSYLGSTLTAGHNFFDPKRSDSFRNASGLRWGISYGDGSGAAGIVGTDTVNVGGVTVTDQAVELATAISRSFLEDTDSDGLMGLAFKKINGVKPTKQDTFFGRVKSSLKRPLFTVDFKTDGSGSYDFGFIDETKHSGNITHVDINNKLGFWQFASPGFEINGKVYDHPGTAIADTGTSLMVVDPDVAEAYWSSVPNAIYSGAYMFPCSQALPSFGVAIGKHGYKVTIPGTLLNYAPVNHYYCYGGVQSNGGNSFQVYGDLMFRSAFVVFYGGASNLGLGFAAKRSD